MSSVRVLEGSQIEGGLTADRNYILNPHAHEGTVGWATYADAAGSSPVDGTGGSPTLTFDQTTSSPLRGVGSFLITTTAADLQGNGASYDFTIDSADQAKVLTISFDYSIASGTYADGDMTVYIYDVTNAQVIQPAGYTIMSATVGTMMFHSATFQTASNSTSYRLILHRAVSTSSAMTMKIDNVVVSSKKVVYGAPVTDWVSYTPSNTQGFGTTSSMSAWWRRVGANIEVQAKFITGTVTASEAQFALPSGLTISSSLPSGRNYVGIAGADTASSTYFNLGVNATAGDSFVNFGLNSSTLSIVGNDRNGNEIAGNSQTFNLHFSVAIQGWSSNVAMSNDTDTRIVAASMNATPTSATFADNANWIFGTVAYDTHSAYSTSTGTFTAPISGYYNFSGQAGITGSSAGTYLDFNVRKDGTTYKTFNLPSLATGEQFVHYDVDIYLNAGQAVTFRFNTDKSSPAISGGTSKNSLNIKRLSGPATIAATEKITARFTTNASQSITTGSNQIIDFEDKGWDSHGAVTTGASWKFTAPRSGYYRVHAAAFLTTGGGWAAGEHQELAIFKNGSRWSYLGTNFETAANTSNNYKFMVGSDIVQLNAGEYVDIRIYQDSGGTILMQPDGQANFVAIESV